MTDCSKCGAQNRPQARFCKKCGAPLERTTSQEGFFGKESVSSEIRKFRDKLKFAASTRAIRPQTRVGLDSLILGPQGSGKKFIAKELVDMIVAASLVDPTKILQMDASDYRKWSESLDEKLSSIADGVLVISNVHKFLSEADSSKMTDLDALFSRMSKVTANMPVVIMTGVFNDMEAYLAANRSVADLFEFHFHLSNLDEKALAGLTAAILKERFGVDMSGEALQKLKAHYEWLVRSGEGTSGNGRLAVRLAEELATNMVSRDGAGTVLPEDIHGKVFVPRSEEQIWKDLDGFVGLSCVKQEIRKIVSNLHEARLELGPEAKISLRDHYVFTGNPGTGKTTIARKFAEILAATGALPKGQFIETDPSKIVGQYIGHSEKNMRDLVDKAMGGVLFIDEAYGLSTSEFGRAAINTLVPLAENRKGEFVCILAGYKREMGDFMKQNSGLASRFNKTIEFPDYSPGELAQIFMINLSEAGYALTEEASEKLHIPMEQMYARRTELFGNGRDVRNFFDAAVDRRSKRLEEMDREARRSEGKVLTYQDLVGEEATKTLSINEVLSSLDSLVGLDGVKRDLKLLAATILSEQKKALRKGCSPVIPVDHYMFLGNPGTGKTTVARMMGKILKSLGVLPTDEVVEVSRADLVASYLGQTAPKTTDAVMRAMGGILFIDEAYSLCNGGQDSFGKECIDTLVPLILNNKGKFVCIVAGYTREMTEFLSVNSGLSSRFTKKIVFEDYSAPQLMEIFRRVVAKNEFRLEPEAEERAGEVFAEMFDTRDRNFGNAREVGNFFEAVRNCHNFRLLEAGLDTTEEQECTLTAEDVASGYTEMKRMKI